ncbi:MAG: YkgJ family cysteine cluster protein [Proteobacteria bacterium]|nr:YkgJ family cysteine cluster protein [Pseudomonadota bacterium]MBU4288596.1 YkgJ family cysteine cluster protein [Pseudomonadota bacterium]MBU4504468.1 YkgJ family cysteine cluster protein [Pseudomonadota bacterium]
MHPIEMLTEIYSDFENSVSEFKKSAACKIGCAYCCIYVGNVDITTMEGIVIQNRMESFEKKLKAKIRRKLDKNKAERERGILAKCAFLKEDNTCRIYDIRPFSCRRIYSIKQCNQNQPVVHRQAIELADYTISKMQQIDDTGYSGHMSFILYLLDKSGFRKAYLGGKFNPGKIMNFGKGHGIIINRFVKPKSLSFNNNLELPHLL